VSTTSISAPFSANTSSKFSTARLIEYPQVRVVAIVEPDSLANIVTNLSDPNCAAAADTYKSLTAYAIKTLTQSNIFLYLDAGHAGWLGWDANITPAAQLFATILSLAGGTFRVRGLATGESCSPLAYFD